MTEVQSMMEKNVEMWEQASGQYMDAMFKAAEKAMEQSTAFQKQVNDAVNAAVSAQLDATLKALKSLEHQVETLAGKVDDLQGKG
ncbi:MAG: hypothetical protein KKA73_07490 [Chloroflexi bacterium]|nr:hypothetical protein [Chloroflexota bacterium]MBU1747514.1 hypothetical protein [Chloroflexota bacterium]